MSKASTSSGGGGGGDVSMDLGASLLLTSKYSKIWRRSLYIGFLISLKKTTSASGSYESPPLSSVPYTPFPPARTSSTKSSVAIDIDFHAEEEEPFIGNENDIAGTVEEQDSKSPLELGGVDRVCDVLRGQRQHSESEDSPIDNGNTPLQVHGTGFTGFLWNSFKQNRYTISMLLISAALSFATEFKQEGPRYGWRDGVAIVFAVILMVAFSSVTNILRQRKMMRLAKRNGQSLMSFDPEKRGLLESLIEKPISYIDKASLFIFTLVALVVFIRLLCKKDGDSGGLTETKGNVPVGKLMQVLERVFLRPSGRISILTGLFTVAILSVQHGVPLMVTISLNHQVDKVVPEGPEQDAVLNDLSACTTMGLVTVICFDVSGGLISKPMEVSRIWIGEEADISKVEAVPDMLRQGVGLSVLAAEFSLSPMSNSLAAWAETTWGMDMKSFPENFDIFKHSKLNSGKEGSGVLVRKDGDTEQVLHLHWSGAASTILEMCSQYCDGRGEYHAMENQKIKFGQVIKEMEDSGLEPIAFAYRQTEVLEELEQDELTLLALIGLKYKCQESTKLSLENLEKTGIQIKLVSEDDIMLVKDIACELGIEVPVDGHDIVLEGKELQDLNEDARLDKVDLAIAMGSFCPEDQVLMVQCLQDKGHVVAFVGKRFMSNHTSEVLQVADVGIVHDSLTRITDRESSGISITCYSALEPIVRAGRSKYHNIQKFIQLQLTISISGLLLTLVTTIITGKSPLTAVQLIWVNVLMCLLGSLMMAMELSSGEELAKKPSDRRNKPIITKEIWRNVIIQVLYQAIVCMILEFGGHVTDESEKKVRETMIFNTFLLCQVFNLLNIMGLLKLEVLKIVVQSYYCFWVALGGCLLMQFVVIEYGKGLADCMGLNATGWAVCVPVGAVPWILEWALKKIRPVILGTNCASSPMDSPESNQQQPQQLGFHLSFMMLLLFPLGLIGMAMTFR